MVEGARLESVYMGNCIEGSNPFLSALLELPLGEMPERLNGAVSKTVIPVRVSRVRIPVSPHSFNDFFFVVA